MITRYQGQPIEAEWKHWRVTSVAVADEYPYSGWWLNGREPGVVHVQYISYEQCRHTPEVGEVYSELRTVESGPILVATLGEEVLYDHRDKE